jgi:hypothetical protein
MAALQQPYQTRTGITNANFTSNYVLVDPSAEVSAMGVLVTAGTATSAAIECTISRPDQVVAGTATWVVAESIINATSFLQRNIRVVTALRLNIPLDGGTWSLLVLQDHNTTSIN